MLIIMQIKKTLTHLIVILVHFEHAFHEIISHIMLWKTNTSQPVLLPRQEMRYGSIMGVYPPLWEVGVQYH